MNIETEQKLFSPVQLGASVLSHRVVMAPLTRSRSELAGDIPGKLMIGVIDRIQIRRRAARRRNHLPVMLLAALLAATSLTQANAPSTAQIRLEGEFTQMALPLNQPLRAWTNIYGMGYRNPAIPGDTMTWWLPRVHLVVEITGKPPVATRVSLGAKSGQKQWSLPQAMEIAGSLGLKEKKADPNVNGAILWSGDHLSLRYLREPALHQTRVEIWTDQDPRGALTGRKE